MSDIDTLMSKMLKLIANKEISKIISFLENINIQTGVELSSEEIQNFKDECLLETITFSIPEGIDESLKNIMKLFIDYGSNINYLYVDDGEEMNGLLVVLHNINNDNKDKMLELLEFLLIQGADPNIMCTGRVYSQEIEIHVENDTSEDLLRKNISNPIEFCSFTPLHRAVSSEYIRKDKRFSNFNFEAINLLIKYGANINLQDSYGNTPLHVTCSELVTEPGIHRCCDLLLSLNADPNIKNAYGNTPLHRSVICKNESAVISLLESDVINTNLKNSNGDTPLGILLKNIIPLFKRQFVTGIKFFSINIFDNLLFKSNPPITFNELEKIKELLNIYEAQVRSSKLSKSLEKDYINIYNKIRDLIVSKILKIEQDLAFTKHLSPRLGSDSPVHLDLEPQEILKYVEKIPSVTKKFKRENYPHSRLEISEESEVESEVPEVESEVPEVESDIQPEQTEENTSLNPGLISANTCVTGNCTILGGKKKIKKITKKKRKSNKKKSNKKKSNKKKSNKSKKKK